MLLCRNSAFGFLSCWMGVNSVKTGFTNTEKYVTIPSCGKPVEEKSTCAYRTTERSLRRQNRMFPELREDVHGADGRWFRRGIAERKVGSDRAACYSGRVCQCYGCAVGVGGGI